MVNLEALSNSKGNQSEHGLSSLSTIDTLIYSSKYLFLLYLIIAAGFLVTLFNCSIQKSFQSNIYIKHLFGFFTLYFLITLVDSQNYITHLHKFLLSIFIYLVFIISTKVYYKIWYLFIILLAFIYLLFILRKDYDVKSSTYQFMFHLQYFLSILSLIILIFGFIYNIGLKKIEYGKDFSYSCFFFGLEICEEDKLISDLPSLSILKSAFN